MAQTRISRKNSVYDIYQRNKFSTAKYGRKTHFYGEKNGSTRVFRLKNGEHLNLTY